MRDDIIACRLWIKLCSVKELSKRRYGKEKESSFRLRPQYSVEIETVSHPSFMLNNFNFNDMHPDRAC